MVAAIYLSNTVHVLTIKIKDFFKGGGGIIWKEGGINTLCELCGTFITCSMV